MNIETLDKLETILGATRNGFEFEPLIEAVGNDDDSRIARGIYLILFGKDSELKRNRDALAKSFAVYFDIEDTTDVDIIDYTEPAYGNFKAEKEPKVA